MYRITVFATMILATALWAEDPPSNEDSVTPAQTETESTKSGATEQIEDLDIDSQEDHTQEDEDVFKPTDVVSFQQSVPFPVDI